MDGDSSKIISQKKTKHQLNITSRNHKSAPSVRHIAKINVFCRYFARTNLRVISFLSSHLEWQTIRVAIALDCYVIITNLLRHGSYHSIRYYKKGYFEVFLYRPIRSLLKSLNYRHTSTPFNYFCVILLIDRLPKTHLSRTLWISQMCSLSRINFNILSSYEMYWVCRRHVCVDTKF